MKYICPPDAQVIEVWVRLLKAVPTARFIVKNKPFACPAAREHVLQLFVKKGIAGHRVDLLPLAAANAGGGICIPHLLTTEMASSLYGHFSQAALANDHGVANPQQCMLLRLVRLCCVSSLPVCCTFMLRVQCSSSYTSVIWEGS